MPSTLVECGNDEHSRLFREHRFLAYLELSPNTRTLYRFAGFGETLEEGLDGMLALLLLKENVRSGQDIQIGITTQNVLPNTEDIVNSVTATPTP